MQYDIWMPRSAAVRYAADVLDALEDGKSETILQENGQSFRISNARWDPEDNEVLLFSFDNEEEYRKWVDMVLA